MKVKIRLFDELGQKEKFTVFADGDPLKLLAEMKEKIIKLFEKGEEKP